MGAILDASTLRDAMSLYLEALEAHREEIDSLNVFPLPDGDTGTNMLLTQRAIVEALEGREGEGLRELGGMIARAALMGARGNSGVILSQILRGFCDRYTITEGEGRMAPDGMDVAGALSAADEEARKAVSEPVEGTILSVLRDAARAATDRARETSDVDSVLEAAFDAAKSSLARTTQALPELKEAGVVDAGGKGLVLLFDAMVSAVRGIPLSTEVGPLGPVGHVEQPAGASTRYGYEVMYLLEGEHAEIPRLRRRLTEVGDSVVVVGGGDMWNVHVHTDDAGTALAAGVAAGTPRAIRISSLDEEVAAHCVADEFRGVVVGDEVPEAPSDLAAPEEKEQALLAVADGAGLEEIFRSLGVAVVRGGPGNNPSVRQLVEAIEAAPGRTVLVLPNHRNILPAAQAAANESGKPTTVVATPSVPQGIAAALAFTPDAGADENETAMVAATQEACVGEIGIAEKRSEWRGGEIEPGRYVGLAAGEILAVGADPAEVAVTLCRELRAGAGPRDPGDLTRPSSCNQLIAVYAGRDASDDDAGRVGSALQEAFPDLEVEVRRGDQPHYPYLIGIE